MRIPKHVHRCTADGANVIHVADAGRKRYRRWRLTYIVAFAAAASASATSHLRPARAQPPASAIGLTPAALDSTRVALSSADWNERHAALARINSAYPVTFPGALVAPILDLLAREASAGVDHAGDEDFGEYLVDLVLTGVRTDDARAIPDILKLDGLGISSGVAAFVAEHGTTVMPALDALAQTREDRASDVAETYALMYSRFGSRLTRSDSAQVLQKLLNFAAHRSPAVRAHLAYVASRGSIAELQPLLENLASSDSGQIDGIYVVRQDATEGLPALRRATAAVTTGDLLNRLTLLTDAACESAAGRLAGQCVALNAHLSTALRHLSETNPRAATAVLAVYRQAVQRLADERVLPRVNAVSLDGTAAAILDRLGGTR